MSSSHHLIVSSLILQFSDILWDGTKTELSLAVMKSSATNPRTVVVPVGGVKGPSGHFSEKRCFGSKAFRPQATAPSHSQKEQSLRLGRERGEGLTQSS